MVRTSVYALSLFLTAGWACGAADSASNRDNAADPSLGHYARATVGVKPIVTSAGSAALSQVKHSPEEWGQGAAGFGRRFASAFGTHIVKRGLQYPLAKLLHEELSYQPSNRQGFGPRLKYALLGVVVTHKTTTEDRTGNYAEISSAVGAGLISRLWQPASLRAAGHGFASAGFILAADAGMNVLREFWPEIRHPHSHGARNSQPSSSFRLNRL